MPKPRPTDSAALSARADKQLDPFPKGVDRAKADRGPDVASVAQVLADVHVTAQGTVVVLAATPHPDSDSGYVAGDDLWDFDNRVKWNQPWTDDVWLDQVNVDEVEVEHFDPTYALLKVAGGRLWAVFPHHLAFTTNGKSFHTLPFR